MAAQQGSLGNARLIGTLTNYLRDANSSVLREQEATQSKLAALERQLRRFACSGQGDNPLADVLTSSIEAATAKLAKTKGALEEIADEELAEGLRMLGTQHGSPYTGTRSSFLRFAT